MATKITDVIVPEIFAAYVTKMTKEKSALIRSGIARQEPRFDEFVAQGGTVINMPFWQPLTGTSEVLSDSRALTPAKIVAAQDVAVRLLRGKAWAANMLAGALAGSSPMQSVAAQVSDWWVRDEQRTLLALLTGAFSGTLSTSHVNDITGATNPHISAGAVLDTKQLLGDAAGQLSTLAMHSITFTELEKQNLITYIPNSEGRIDFPYYLGYRVIVDDMCPYDSATGELGTFLFADGCIARGEGTPVDLVPVDVGREPLEHLDYLVHRRSFLLHLSGVKWTNAYITSGESTPTNDDLVRADNWEKVVEDKAVGAAMLVHTIE